MKESHFSFWRLMPVAVATLLLVVVALVAFHTVGELKQATYWREQTFQTILDAQNVEDTLIDAQSGERRFLQSGQAKLLLEYRSDTNVEVEELNRLNALTKDSPEQQARLRELTAAIQAVFSNDDRIIGLYARQGADAALKAEGDHDSAALSDNAIHDLEQFTGEEKKLLATRDASEQADYHKTARVLILGSLLAALLLVGASYVAGRENARRRAAELRQRTLIAELQQALAEVKTLSGLIPICSWCKQMRADTGFWQSVEQYLRSHTEARFTHGVCPTCLDRVQAEFSREASGQEPGQ